MWLTDVNHHTLTKMEWDFARASELWVAPVSDSTYITQSASVQLFVWLATSHSQPTILLSYNKSAPSTAGRTKGKGCD